MPDVSSPRGPAATIGEFLQHALPNGFQAIPAWPPDVFAVAAALLHRSGAYNYVVEGWPPGGQSLQDWLKEVYRLSQEWRKAYVAGEPLPVEVVVWWGLLVGRQADPIGFIRENALLCEVLLSLCSVADEACWGLGIPPSDQLQTARARNNEDISVTKKMSREAHRVLLSDDSDAMGTLPAGGASGRNGSTLCKQIHPSRLRVLPKLHTPQNGLTVRSFSRNLALCTGAEICPTWHLMSRGPGEQSINLLVIPWPEEVRPSQFAAVAQVPDTGQRLPERHRFFTWKPSSDALLPDVQKLHQRAESVVGTITGVIFPELALTPAQYSGIRTYLLEKNVAVICGLSEPSTNGPGQNYFQIDLPLRDNASSRPSPRGSFSKRQYKHHRWMLDKSQIIQYGLGSQLSPSKFWWEHIAIRDRSLMFLALRDWLTVSVLICEDLARPDPVGEIVRAVGPSLVIALLMDGPQLASRWSGRYATVLADDPGSSVLSVTSLGMTKLSRPPYVQARSRVIALWKDAKSGTPVEIELPQGANAVVLSLTVQYIEEWTADGRSDQCTSGYPILAGIHPISLA